MASITKPGSPPTEASPQAVSVVIPTYNRAALIARAVSSVLEQCYEGDEVIVIDDGSTDGTREALGMFMDRIVYKYVQNGGVSRARNTGLQLAQSPLVAYLDSDDQWLPYKLHLQRELMAALPEVQFCYSESSRRLSSGETIDRAVALFWDDPHVGATLLGAGIKYSTLAALPDGCDDFLVHVGSLYAPSLKGPSVWCSTALVRMSEIGREIGFPEDISYSEDWEYFSRLAQKGLAAFMDLPTALMHADHGHPQLVDCGSEYQLSTLIKVTERVWGADPDFVWRENSHYGQILDERRVALARLLLRSGRRKEARSHIRLVAKRPPGLWLRSWFPAWLLKIPTLPRIILVKVVPRRAQSFIRSRWG